MYTSLFEYQLRDKKFLYEQRFFGTGHTINNTTMTFGFSVY